MIRFSVDDEHTDQNETSGDGSFVLPYRELSMTQKANLRQAKKFCEALTSQWVGPVLQLLVEFFNDIYLN